MKLKKCLLVSAIFAVVSLCSCIVAYGSASDVTGTVESILSYDPMVTYNSQGTAIRSSAPVLYDFPLAGRSLMFDIQQYTKYSISPPSVFNFKVRFDEPYSVASGDNFIFDFNLGSNSYGVAGISSYTFSYLDSVGTYQTIPNSNVTLYYNDGSFFSGVIELPSSSAPISGINIKLTPRYGSYTANTLSKVYLDFCCIANLNDKGTDDIYALLADIYTTEQDIDTTLIDILSELQHGVYFVYDRLVSLDDVSSYHVLPYSSAVHVLAYLVENYLDKDITWYAAPDVYDPAFVGHVYSISYNSDGFIQAQVQRGTPTVYVSYLCDQFGVPYYIPPTTNYGSEILDILQNQFGDGREQLDDAAGEAKDALDAQEELESQFQGSMTSNFNALNVSSFSFDSDAQSGLAMVGTIFGDIYDAFGKWSILYSFPLLLGVVLLLIGKLSKTGGRGSSRKDGEDE